MDFQLSLESEGVGSAYPDQPLATASDATLGEVLSCCVPNEPARC